MSGNKGSTKHDEAASDDVERQLTPGDVVPDAPNGAMPDAPAVARASGWRSGSLSNLHWDSGNREDGREDVGSIHSSSVTGSRPGSRAGSRAGSKHGGSHFFGGDRSGHAGERSVHGGSVHGASRSTLNGSKHGGSNFGSRHGGSAFSPEGDSLRPPGFELPGQGGPLQDNTGLSAASMEAQAPGKALGVAAVAKPAMKGLWWPIKYLAYEWRGRLDTAHPRPAHWWGLIIMPLGAFLGILWIAGINRYTYPDLGMQILLPTFGASAVLLFGVPESKLSQPRNFLGGQFVSVVTGCTVRSIFSRGGTEPVASWVAAPVGVGVALLLMQITRTVHPPGGATALLSASADPIARWAGWILVPAVMIGSVGMQIIALFLNAIAPGRRYPTFWWGADNFVGGL